MRKLILEITFLILFCTTTFAQSDLRIFTTDMDNFWTAYDSINMTDDYSMKIDFINCFYIEKGTNGLKAFMEARQYTDSVWVELIGKYPKFWNSVRPNTLAVKSKIPGIEKAVERLKKLYPGLKDAEMYFTIGGLRSGGTVNGKMVLIGCEIATGNAATDVSEFKTDWLKNVFSKQSLDYIVALNIHEYIHTQQTGDRKRVLNQSIKEGACDFITELVMDKPLVTQYLTNGNANATAIKELFRKEMFSDNFDNWLYNGGSKGADADLGYYIGYEICKAYYNQAKEKSQAIKDIIELNYNNDKAVERFLDQSKFYSTVIEKKK